jgi:16S rRNA (cytosine967-C5)-methyltransferase
MTALMSKSITENPSARSVALDLLEAVLQKKISLDQALARHIFMAVLEDRDRNHARAMVSTTLRRLGQIDALIEIALERPLPRKSVCVKNILRLGIVQLLFMNTPPHAAVDTAVKLAQDRGHGPHKKLVNAVLRRISREGGSLIEKQDAARLNTPDWLWNSWLKAYGAKDCRDIAEVHLTEAPLDITAPHDTALWAKRLEAKILSTGTLRRDAGGLINELPGFKEGAWWVQGAAASLPVRLLGDVKNKHVIDLCAAPGGKTAQLAQAGAKVTAVDRSEKRLALLQNNMTRLNLDINYTTADAALWRPDNPASAVLLDAPCSSTGTIRRHPDVAHLKSPADVVKLAEVQKRLLDAAVDMVRPGGLIVFCLCSLEPEEGPALARALQANSAAITHVPILSEEVGGNKGFISNTGDLRTLPCHLREQGGIEGFFAARFQRQ